MNEKNKKFLFLTYIPVLLLCIAIRLVTKERYESLGWISYILIPSIIATLSLFWLKEIFFKLNIKNSQNTNGHKKQESLNLNDKNTQHFIPQVKFNKKTTNETELTDFIKNITKQLKNNHNYFIEDFYKLTTSSIIKKYFEANYRNSTSASQVAEDIFKVIKNPKEKINQILIKKTREQLLNSYVLDFYTESLMNAGMILFHKTGRDFSIVFEHEPFYKITKALSKICFLSQMKTEEFRDILVDAAEIYEKDRERFFEFTNNQKNIANKRITENIKKFTQ